ncbi:uncharacterized protein LOC135143773 [Zophobas morio]|uniref:uncharacterized protein LOC135143773 n=1 Tax=Zophobas morio TaxID=2755281 RepID=UPI0030838A24
MLLEIKFGLKDVFSGHFTEEDYITPNECCFARRVLKTTAIPTQNLPKAGERDIEHMMKQKENRLKRLNRRRQIQEELVENETTMRTRRDNLEVTAELEAAATLMQFSVASSSHSQEVLEELNQSSSFNQTISEKCVSASTQTEITNNAFSKCVVNQSTQVQMSWFSIVSLIQTEKVLKILTGLPSFEFLDQLANSYLIVKKDSRVKRLSIKERILLTFMKCKLDLTYSALCVFFFYDISVPTYCTEIPVQTPKKLCCRIKLYSHYKKHHTLKYMTAVTPSGFICYVSPSYGGRASDKSIFEQSKLLDQLEPYVDQIMVDKGFLIDKVCDEYGIKLLPLAYILSV